MTNCISREEAKELHCQICMDKNICYQNKENCEDLKLFDNLSSVNPERVKGHWIDLNTNHDGHCDDYDDPYVKCSECGCCNGIDDSSFCPCCGADMRGGKGK